MFKPLISVIIPTYNRDKYICDAVDSILVQGYRNFELIVVNDGSKDKTIEVLQKYGSNIRLINKINGGVSAARNTGIEASKGEYIAYLDSDDLWKPNKLERFVTALNEVENKKCLIFSNIERFNVLKGNRLEFSQSEIFPFIYTYFSKLPNSLYEAGGDLLFRFLLRRYDIYPSSMLVHRDLHNKYLWEPQFKYCEDYLLYLQFSSEFDFYYVDEILTTIRLHDDNATWNSEARIRGLLRATVIYSKMMAKDTVARRMCSYLCGRICKDRVVELMAQGEFLKSTIYLFRLMAYPTYFYDTALKKICPSLARVP